MTTQNENIWNGSYKIPWDELDFSRRMLTEHLSQDHDLASRRLEWIDRQVQWIHDQSLDREPSTILDLGCGPGLYSHRLVRLGYRCRGIDFAPASIEYAQEHNPHASGCGFVVGDIRNIAFGGPYNLAMILYGELNVFSPADALMVLRKAQASLAPQGQLIIEMQAPSAVELMGVANHRSRNQSLDCSQIALIAVAQKINGCRSNKWRSRRSQSPKRMVGKNECIAARPRPGRTMTSSRC